MDGTGFHTDRVCHLCGNPQPICDPCWCRRARPLKSVRLWFARLMSLEGPNQ